MKESNNTTHINTDCLDDLQVVLLQAKSVARAYSTLYTESSDIDERIIAIRADPDGNSNLFSVLFDLICKAGTLAASI